MNYPRRQHVRWLAVLSIPLYVAAIQAQAQQSRITQRVDNGQRFTLAGHISPRARGEYDQGRVAPSLVLTHITLSLATSAEQKAALDALLAAQQDPSSADYHHWLTPDEFGARFGANEADLAKITSWLEMQGLTVTGIARSRNWVSADGTAAQVEQAFQTEIHQYIVNGERHFANATEPSLPAAFRGVVGGIRGLNDFRMKPPKRTLRTRTNAVSPEYTTSSGDHFLAPDDFATIYNINPVYTAGINGAGQKLVIAGQTQIYLSDIKDFRTSFGLPANDPQIVFVPKTQDPGLRAYDLPEANLDLEWSGAVARDATIIYVYSNDVMDAVQYAIDQNLAPVVSVSYGRCEPESDRAGVSILQSWARQANAQGITWLNASGDSGAADCADPAHPGLAVDVPASIPEITGVGGTEFNEGSGQYWNASNDSTRASALSYIPETSWNTSAADGTLSASGGGASTYFSKPSWQTGPGVPNDNSRHVPDIAFSASNNHDPYIVYTGGQGELVGGTSAAAPAFAGILALLNQYLVSSGIQSTAGVGNINPKLYSMAQNVSGVFHDVTTGDNIVTVSCPPQSRSCTPTPVGYRAGVGYDQVTGLGSVDAYAFINAVSGKKIPAIRPITSMTLIATPTSVNLEAAVTLTATITTTSGNTPTGTVFFARGSVSLGSAVLVGSGGTATATLVVPGAEISQGAGVITAEYSGDAAITASTTVVASPASSSTKPSITALVNAASFQPVFAPGMILTVFGSHLASSNESASAVPLPASMASVAATVNGVAAPLYYISPGQLNIQLPFETAPNSTAVVYINNNGRTTSQSFTVAAAAPGILTDHNGAPVPGTSAARGQIVTLYTTGAGALSPPVATGAAPAFGTAVSDLPQPTQTVSLTVGGNQAPIQFIGVPSGLVGLVQINYQVPQGITPGAQQVVVTVGGVASAPATLTVTN
jgi:uncharacterized protein (TIGR03437 family)